MPLGRLTRRAFARRVDTERVRQAIAAAERRTSGEIAVSVSTAFWGDVQRAAERAFARLGVARTADRNGVLLFVVPWRRQLVVIGDVGIHARVGAAFWAEVAEEMGRGFHAGDVTGALVAGIERIAGQLAEHFPPRGEADVNELRDVVDVR